MNIHLKINSIIQELSEQQQLRLLEFAKGLLEPKEKKEKNKLLKLAGSISKTELTLMSKAINEDCSKIDLDEW